jgi:type I restriction enzyme S subunit
MARITPCLENGKIARFQAPDGTTAHGSTEFIVIRGREGVTDDSFAYYLTRWDGVSGYAIGQMTGSSGRQRVPTSAFDHLLIRVPPLPEQRAIAHILGTLDDKIALNRRMSATLEEMARALFKAWFVDFEPVRAKMAGRPSASAPGELGALFPARLVPSELGEIPEGWGVGSIDHLARYVNGQNFTKDASGTGRVVIRIRELNSGIGSTTVLNDVAADDDNVARPNDILFAWSGSLGLYRWHAAEALVNQHIFKVIPEGHPKWFVYYALDRAMTGFVQIAAGKATTMGHIQRSHLAESLLVMPNEAVMEHATQVFGPVFEQGHELARESATLAALRDALLPRLVSGALRVGEAA